MTDTTPTSAASTPPSVASTSPGYLSNAQLADAVQKMVDRNNKFTQQQAGFWTSNDDTVEIDDGNGNEVMVPSWHQVTTKLDKLGLEPDSNNPGGNRDGTSGAADETVTDKSIHGTVAIRSLNVTYAPVADSDAVIIARRNEIDFNGGADILKGGYLCGAENVILTGGISHIDKIVGHLSQLNLNHSGRAPAAICYEAEISAIGNATLLSGFCGYYFPNLASVKNVDKLPNKRSFVCQDRRFSMWNEGQTFNENYQELSPGVHPGLVPGRYYWGDGFYVGYTRLNSTTTYLNPVYLPHKAAVTELGLGVQKKTAGAKATLAMYRAIGGGLGNMVIPPHEIAASAAGAAALSLPSPVELDAGLYFIAVQLSVNMSIATHSPYSPAARYQMIGSTHPLDSGDDLQWNMTIANTSYGAMPPGNSAAPTALTYSTNRWDPHLWFRVGDISMALFPG